MGESLTLCIDLDGTICSKTENHKYHLAIPNEEMISKVNRLYENGNYIKIFTARGMVSGMEFKKLTTEQLKVWGVKYNELIMNKPSADFYIDDKSMTPEEFINTLL